MKIIPKMQTNNNTENSNGCIQLCSSPKTFLFTFLTLLTTTGATAVLSAAIITDHWELVTWDSYSLNKITNNSIESLEWMLNEKVGILTKKNSKQKPIFLVPMHGGIWTLCINLNLTEMTFLKRIRKFPVNIVPCVSYLNDINNVGYHHHRQRNEDQADLKKIENQTFLQPHLRMQNLSISCSIVCLIILGSAALLGIFGICQKQISAILITGIMYLLAVLFALFTLMIMHYKRQHGRPIIDNDFKNSTVDGLIGIRRGSYNEAHKLLEARIITTSWSMMLGWTGVGLCCLTSVLWISLSKILKFNPMSSYSV